MASGICYIMTNRQHGVLYTGVTTDIGRRAFEHRDGTVLIASAARFWFSKGGRNLIVLSMAGNTQATAFYEALGGLQVYEGSFEIGGTKMADKGHLFSNLADLAAHA